MNEFDTPSEHSDHRFPCEVCGADLRYDPEHGALSCAHCGDTTEILAPPQGWEATELDLRAAFENGLQTIENEVTQTAHCTSCGADIQFDGDAHAAECAYCASPIVADTGENRHIKPHGIIPFLVTHDRARKLLGEWLGRRWFAPNGIAKYARKGSQINGIYVPYWTYDAQTQTEYRGQRGTVYYVTVGSGKNRRRVQRVRWSRKSGRVRRFFDDVLVLATRALPTDFARRLAPWELSGLEPYNTEFLAGFRAEAYNLPLDEGFDAAQAIMKNTIIRDIKFDIGGDRQRIDQMKTAYGELSFKHVLLPVYTMAYRFRGKSYQIFINGQSGRISGERPYSIWKITFAVIAAIIAGAALLYFLEASGAFENISVEY